MLGPEYALLRREFRRVNPRSAVNQVAKRLLVSFGGSDPDGLTAKALQTMSGKLQSVITTVVIGSDHPGLPSFQRSSAPGL
jgi:spore coat polysaccharide biosynthesis predicted glycosyltransferase SpsG